MTAAEYDRPTIPNTLCSHPRAAHHHGTYACYTSDQCRCDDCRAANARHARFLRRQLPSEPAARVRARILALGKLGWTQQQIADEAGITQSGVSNIALGYNLKVRRAVADRILAIEPAARKDQTR